MASPATVSGGPLGDTYQLIQYHFHWGNDESSGSENQMDGTSYPLEMHMVHWNTKYDSFATAATQPDGLAVLGFFFDATGNDNPAFGFVSALTSIEHADSTAEYQGHPSLQSLLPGNLKSYFTVLGSLTTPPCSEVVTWLNFKQTIKISSAQLQMFHQLMDHEGHEIEHNFRPPQPLNGRVVYSNTGSV
jgi:carbonic anhydrase